MFGKTFPKNRHAKAKSYSRQIKTTPLKAWVLDTSNKQGRLTGTKVNWERLGNNFDENCRNLFKTQPTKSKLWFFDFVVVFAACDIVIDIPMATAGASSSTKIHRCENGSSKKITQKQFKKLRQTKTKVTPGKLKQPQWKQGLWEQHINNDN